MLESNVSIHVLYPQIWYILCISLLTLYSSLGKLLTTIIFDNISRHFEFIIRRKHNRIIPKRSMLMLILDADTYEIVIFFFLIWVKFVDF